MRRREFIAGLGGAAACSFAARAQQGEVPTIGLLNAQSPGSDADYIAAFHQGLAETGHVEGKNVTIERYWGEGRVDRVVALAGEMVRNRYALIVVLGSTPGALALKAASRTIPIVFHIGPDPVAVGLVASLNRPGGNVTGVSLINVEVIAKRLALLHELAPGVKSVAHLVNPANTDATEAETKEMQRAASLLDLRLVVLNVRTINEVETAFATVFPRQAGALIVGGDSFFSANRDRVVALAARYRVPSAYSGPRFTAAGGLMSYGADIRDSVRVAGVYAGRILKGERPADLPVQQATTIGLAINLKTAKALGLTIPETLLATADEVIQ
jgi:putative tryptophan/tyrosine transport system substrate-binding protein